MTTIHVTARRWAFPDDPQDQRVILTFCDPAKPGVLYETAPCPNTVEGEQGAVQAAVDARRAAGLDYPGMPPPSVETIAVT